VPFVARQRWHDAQLGFWQTMDKRPFAIGIAALAAGVAAGLTVPSSRKEKELMGETRDRLLDQAKGLTRDALDMGRQVARVATETVRTEAERQGLTASDVAQRVRTVAREAEEAVKSEADRVIPEPLKATGTPIGTPGYGTTGGTSNFGGAAGRGMTAGFASTPETPQTGTTSDPDATVPGSFKPTKPRT
jgi:hypothetical protein